MKQFKTIFKFELGGYFKNKAFVGITLFLVIAIAAVMFFPRVKPLFVSDDGVDESRPVMLVECSFAGEIECAFYIDTPTEYTYYVNNLSLYDTNSETASAVLKQPSLNRALTSAGLSASEVEAVMSVEPVGNTVGLGKNQMNNFFYTYIMIFALYTVILLYGQMVATNVATEKSSRAMEVLITSAKPTSLMFGKVIASCIAGFIQLLAVFGTANTVLQYKQKLLGQQYDNRFDIQYAV